MGAQAAGALAAACRPRTSLGVLFPAVEVASLRAWLASGVPGPALATAGPGSGLTTTVQLLLGEAGVESVWVACGTARTKALLAQAGANPVSVTLRRKVIVVDEFDAIAACDAAAGADILSFARSKPPVPVLVLAHATRSSKSLEYAKTWPKFCFGRPSAPAVAACLRQVAATFDIAVAADCIDALAKSVKGDVRAALNALDLHRRSPSQPGGQATAQPGDQGMSAKDETTEGLDLVEAVLRGERGRTVRDCLKMFAMETAVLPMGLYENYPAGLGAGDLGAAAVTADAFSKADTVDRYMYSRQAWDCFDLYGTLAVAATSLGMRRHRRSKPNPALGVTKFGSVWSKVYNMCAKTKHIRGLAFRYADAGAAPLSACDLAWVRRCVRDALSAEPGDGDELVKRVTWPLRAADVMCLARLETGQSWYTHAMHGRVKKLLAGRGA